MNVFVLCSGRCGSLTFTRACSHITNFTAGHESRVRELGSARLAYPDQHIECDNRLAWMLGRLDRQYGDQARYVHLTRRDEDCAESFNRRWERGGIMMAYGRAILMRRRQHGYGLPVCHDFLETIDANIAHFLKDKTHWMPFRLEQAAEDFSRLLVMDRCAR